MADYNHVFEDFENELREMHDEIMDRFGDEHDEEQEQRPSTCGECADFEQCPIEGHTSVGLCRLSDEWRQEFDECDAYD
jgi:hypothetical protein